MNSSLSNTHELCSRSSPSFPSPLHLNYIHHSVSSLIALLWRVVTSITDLQKELYFFQYSILTSCFIDDYCCLSTISSKKHSMNSNPNYKYCPKSEKTYLRYYDEFMTAKEELGISSVDDGLKAVFDQWATCYQASTLSTRLSGIKSILISREIAYKDSTFEFIQKCIHMGIQLLSIQCRQITSRLLIHSLPTITTSNSPCCALSSLLLNDCSSNETTKSQYPHTCQ